MRFIEWKTTQPPCLVSNVYAAQNQQMTTKNETSEDEESVLYNNISILGSAKCWMKPKESSLSDISMS